MRDSIQPLVGTPVPSKCKICDSIKIECIHQDSWHFDGQMYDYTLWQCMSCNVCWVHPIPSASVFFSLYPQEYRSNQTRGIDAVAQKQYSDVKLLLAQKRFNKNFLVRAIPSGLEYVTGRTFSLTLGVALQMQKNARMLDVGCGAGGWLLAMHQLGYGNLFGQDLDDTSATHLEQHGIEFCHAPLEECIFSEHQFDLVRMEHVLEHIADPVEFLMSVRRLLKPGGIFVIGVPNIASLSFELTRLNWHALELPRHLFQYTPKALTCLANRTGYRVVQMQHLPVWQQMTNSVRTETKFFVRLLKHRVIGIAAAPIWGLATRIVQRGDFIAVAFQSE
jgi:2-polyprenyl-3-methyl-5-hydroxy-6-metoxy-1,4-benzoquinol methylase